MSNGKDWGSHAYRWNPRHTARTDAPCQTHMIAAALMAGLTLCLANFVLLAADIKSPAGPLQHIGNELTHLGVFQ